MTYEVNNEHSYIKWLDFTGESKIIQVVFDKYDVVRQVSFCIYQCIYEQNNKARLGDVLKKADEEYIKDTMDEKPVVINPQIIKTYDEVKKISFAPEHN